MRSTDTPFTRHEPEPGPEPNGCLGMIVRHGFGALMLTIVAVAFIVAVVIDDLGAHELQRERLHLCAHAPDIVQCIKTVGK